MKQDRHMQRSFLLLLFSVSWVSQIQAGVGDPTIETDHPDYAGEGAFQSIEKCVEFATHEATSSQERAIALYLWLLEHQYHLMSPQEWCVPGRNPDTAVPGDYELVPFDANRSRFSYGYGLCGTVHAWNEPYWNALGMRPRRRAFPGHVNSEIFYDDSWHAFDTDMAGLLFRKDGIVAGYDDIIADPSLVDSVKPPLPHYPYAWPGDWNTMKQGWLEIARSDKKWYSLYNSGYAAQPGIVNLRAGETFTRWYDRDHFGGPSKRRFWHHLAGGPRRNWTFMNSGKPFHNKDQSNSRNDASYCNAEFVYEPRLASEGWREGAVRATGNVSQRAPSPKLYSSDGKTASATFEHFSPYVICGDPVDDANSMSGRATDGFVIAGRMSGDVAVALSVNQGLTWQEIPISTSGEGAFVVDLTEQVKGRYGWQVKFTWKGDAGMEALKFTTVCQVAQGIYPRLTENGCEISYRSASRGVVAVLPDFGLSEDSIGQIEELSLRSSNVEYTPRTPKSRFAYRTLDNQPGQVVYRIDSPETLQEVRAAMRYQVRVPPPEKTDYRLEYSVDGGQHWQTMAVADIPADNEFSSGWLAGRADVSKADVKSVLVRLNLYAGGYRTGLIDAQFYGIYETPRPQEINIEYGWKDGDGKLQTCEVTIPAGTEQKQFTVPTGKNITDDFVRLSVPAR
jgi:hypothetical protein